MYPQQEGDEYGAYNAAALRKRPPTLAPAALPGGAHPRPSITDPLSLPPRKPPINPLLQYSDPSTGGIEQFAKQLVPAQDRATQSRDAYQQSVDQYHPLGPYMAPEFQPPKKGLEYLALGLGLLFPGSPVAQAAAGFSQGLHQSAKDSFDRNVAKSEAEYNASIQQQSGQLRRSQELGTVANLDQTNATRVSQDLANAEYRAQVLEDRRANAQVRADQAAERNKLAGERVQIALRNSNVSAYFKTHLTANQDANLNYLGQKLNWSVYEQAQNRALRYQLNVFDEAQKGLRQISDHREREMILTMGKQADLVKGLFAQAIQTTDPTQSGVLLKRAQDAMQGVFSNLATVNSAKYGPVANLPGEITNVDAQMNSGSYGAGGYAPGYRPYSDPGYNGGGGNGAPGPTGGYSGGTHGALPFATPQGMYDSNGLKQLWMAAGGNPQYADLMASVALHGESAGNPYAANPGGTGLGLWQINPQAHGAGNWQDPMTNARMAVTLFNDAMKHGNPLQPWEDSRWKGASPGGWNQYAAGTPWYRVPDHAEADFRNRGTNSQGPGTAASGATHATQPVEPPSTPAHVANIAVQLYDRDHKGASFDQSWPAIKAQLQQAYSGKGPIEQSPEYRAAEDLVRRHATKTSQAPQPTPAPSPSGTPGPNPLLPPGSAQAALVPLISGLNKRVNEAATKPQPLTAPPGGQDTNVLKVLTALDDTLGKISSLAAIATPMGRAGAVAEGAVGAAAQAATHPQQTAALARQAWFVAQSIARMRGGDPRAIMEEALQRMNQKALQAPPPGVNWRPGQRPPMQALPPGEKQLMLPSQSLRRPPNVIEATGQVGGTKIPELYPTGTGGLSGATPRNFPELPDAYLRKILGL